MNGEVFGPYLLGREYRITERAEVRAATDSRSDLPLTIKLLRADLLADPTYRAELERRLDLLKSGAAGLPLLVDFDLSGAHPYIGTRTFVGRDLASRAESGEVLSSEQACTFARQLCSAVGEAHRLGLSAAPSLRPTSVLVGADGSALLADLEQPLEPLESAEEARYLAPETLAGHANDIRSDLHSLSCLLYYGVSGQPAFRGDTIAAVAAAKQAALPGELGGWRSDLPDGLLTAIRRGLDQDPERRPANVAEYVRLLAGPAVSPFVAAPVRPAEDPDATIKMPVIVPTSPPPTAPRPQPGNRPRGVLWFALAALAAGALLVGALWMALRDASGGTEVPRLIGLSESKAKAALADAGLKGVKGAATYDPEVAEGLVVSQVPSAGRRQDPKLPVSYALSLGSRTVAVPRLLNATEAQAKAAVAKAGLKYGGSETSRVPNELDNVVVRQKPQPGEVVERSTKVYIVINRRPKESPAKPEIDPPPTSDAAGSLVDDAAKRVGEAAGQAAKDLLHQATEAAAEAGREATRQGIEKGKEWLKDQWKGRDGNAPTPPEGSGQSSQQEP